ncbi:hypothetical protein L198_05106 [Cryptococcus wingfieldii CBS 7118]|uniref:Uncharacterized protein n=1 Tax=Cryptococcus wingfieldii CBS 7118 TaxID=1295528 RepID=A0A1E3J040_9TREE|nr:hypothetical protein L198_05106 [Cryptococcus wingfieldii CBS 7118]ODN94250.1 hypothetical protein L198_05106 [Cryptococcus wingfieldii CBS 7118]
MSNATPQQMELTAMPSAGPSEKHQQEPFSGRRHPLHPPPQPAHEYPQARVARGLLSLLLHRCHIRHRHPGGLGNVFGLVIAGLCMEASYKWFFRVIAILCFASTAVTLIFLPHTPAAPSKDGVPKWRKMDVPVLPKAPLMDGDLPLSSRPSSSADLLPSASSTGSPSFPQPLPSFPAPSEALPTPSSPPLSCSSPWPSGVPPSSSRLWLEASARLGCDAPASNYDPHIVGALSQVVPAILNKPRWTIPIGAVLIIIAEILQIKSNGGPGKDYWRYVAVPRHGPASWFQEGKADFRHVMVIGLHSDRQGAETGQGLVARQGKLENGVGKDCIKPINQRRS